MAEIHIRLSNEKELQPEHLNELAEKFITVTDEIFHFENGKKDVGVLISKSQALRNVADISILGICSYTDERLGLQKKWAKSLKQIMDEIGIKGEVFVLMAHGFYIPE